MPRELTYTAARKLQRGTREVRDIMLAPGELLPHARLFFACMWTLADEAPTVRSVLGMESTRAETARLWRESWRNLWKDHA